MENSTTKSKVTFGIKAVDKVIPSAYSTSVSANSNIGIKMNYCKDNSIDSRFHKVNISDQKRQNAYRKINKMLAGW